MRKVLASVLLAGLSLPFIACGGGSSNNGGTGGNGGGGGNPPPVTLSSITVSPAAASIAPGTTAQFTAKGNFSDGSSKDLTSQVTWKSSAPSVATINLNGVIGLAKAVAPGSATISASMSGVSGTSTLTVTNATLLSITVTPAAASIDVGTQQQFTALGKFDDGTSQDISNVVNWSSSSGIASIATRSGLATGNTTGTTTITATFTSGSLSIQGTAQLTVTLANMVSISIKAVNPGSGGTAANPSIAVNTSQAFTAIGTFTDGSTHNVSTLVSWSSSTPSVATIGLHNPTAQGIAPGTTTISATTGAVTGSIPLTVTSATLASIAVAPSGQSIPVGVKLNLTAVGSFSDGTTQDLTVPSNWASTNPSVATVSNSGASSGLTTSVSPGSTTITATAPASLGSVVGSATLTVNTATLQSIAVKISGNGKPFTAPGGTVAFTAKGAYSDGTTQDITKAVSWGSSNHAVATIAANGVATAQGSGTTNISATQGGITGTQGLLVTSSQLSSITISAPNAGSKLAQQTSVQLTATGHFADGSTQNLTNIATWTSSAPSVATVSRNGGIATGVAPGTTNITVVFAGANGSLNLQVTNATLTGVTISPKSPSPIALGSVLQFTAKGTFSDGSTEILTIFSNWNSSNTGVAIINNFGLLTTAGTGTTTITVTASQGSIMQSDSATLTVQ
jgi:trimeric autotransporter adhesin